jgi:hypothetical protein
MNVSKHFFFEKKKQKTFKSPPLPRCRQAYHFEPDPLEKQKFFGSFFQKGTSLCA